MIVTREDLARTPVAMRLAHCFAIAMHNDSLKCAPNWQRRSEACGAFAAQHSVSGCRETDVRELPLQSPRLILLVLQSMTPALSVLARHRAKAREG